MIDDLSLSMRLKKYIKQVKDNYSRVLYYEKYFSIVEYIELFGIFTVSTILDEMREDKKIISHRTISRYCRYLMIDKFLNFVAIQTRFKKDCQLFWLDSVNNEEVLRMKDYYVKINKPLKGTKNKNSGGNKKLYQKTLDTHFTQSLAHRNARQKMDEVRKMDYEKEHPEGLQMKKLQLTEAEYEKVKQLPPAAQKYFKSGFADSTSQYYKDRRDLNEQEALKLFTERKNKLWEALQGQEYIEF